MFRILKRGSAGRSRIKMLAVAAGAFLLMLAFPFTAQAAAAVTNLTMDRTSVQAGQSINFSIRTTTQTNFVFAVVDGLRTQATRISTDAAGNHNWSLTVTPTRTTNVVIFANTTNSEAGAASISVPVTVAGTTGTGPGTPGATTPPPPPIVGNLGPLDIADLRETPATSAGYVQLTVVTGTQVNYVWVNFDRQNNQRGTGRFAQGTIVSQDANSRTWTINFRPNTWASQLVEVGANRTYNWPGATVRSHTLTLAHPFIPQVAPGIQFVTVSPRDVNPGGRTTLTIRTNTDVTHVWVRDVDGREHEARRINPTTPTTFTWEVFLYPPRSGSVTIFANSNRSSVGASQHSEVLNVRGAGVSILEARAIRVGGGNNRARITVRTNRDAESVWVIVNNIDFPLYRISGTGTANRTWELEIDNVHVPIQVRASAHTNHLISIDAATTINNFGGAGQGGGHWEDETWGNHEIERIRRTGRDELIRHGNTTQRTTTFEVTTSQFVTDLEVTGSNIEHWDVQWVRNLGNNRQEWFVTIRINPNHPQGDRRFTIQAREGNSTVDTAETPYVWVRN